MSTDKPGGLKALMNIRKEEWPLALLMSGYFFLVITTFWILKPIKKGLFIGYYKGLPNGLDLGFVALSGSQAEQIAKVLNMVVAFVAVTVFTWVVRRQRRQQVTFTFSTVCIAALVVFSALLSGAGDVTVWSFYLFGDLYSTLMVATFFAFLNDSVASEQAKRLYGLVGLGGVAGGAFGSITVRGLISRVDHATWMWVCVGIGLLIVVLAWAAGRLVERNPPPEAEEQPAEEKPAGNPALEGARLVFRSRYLLSVVAIVGLYEVVSTVMDFQFSQTVELLSATPEEAGKQFSTVYALTNAVSAGVQLFLTSFVMTRFGVGVALLVLPVAALSGSMLFLAVPVLWTGSLLNTADNAFSYSINQSAKEALYVPTSRDEKYKAKAFIDMFVQRFAKALAVGLNLGITLWVADFAGLRWLSVITVAVGVVWVIAARYAGRKFKEMEGRTA